MNSNTIDRVVGILFFLHLCVLTIFTFDHLKIWGGVSSLFIGKAQLYFWIRLSLDSILCMLISILFALHRSSVKWILLLYVFWYYVGGRIWGIKPNSPDYYSNVNSAMKTLIETSRSMGHFIKAVYVKLFVPIFFISTLLYAFIFRTQRQRSGLYERIKGFKRTSLIGFALPFIPVAVILFALSLRNAIMYDVDVPVFLALLLSPVFFGSGLIVSAVARQEIGRENKLERTFVSIGIVLNLFLLVVAIYSFMNISF